VLPGATTGISSRLATMKPDQADRLTCVECGREQAAARGWRAYLTVDEAEPAEAVVYCPECSDREFGRPA
jgi:hypothetical protein